MNQDSITAARETQRDRVLEQLADLLAHHDITPPSSLHAIAQCLLENRAEVAKILRDYQNALDTQVGCGIVASNQGDYGDENYQWRDSVDGAAGS